ncbi:hypothetical protein SAMN05216436_1213 [bacterium A37T11]|nr:hypothetical protein SAMN05216436_1213 [bacterium A37T11]
MNLKKGGLIITILIVYGYSYGQIKSCPSNAIINNIHKQSQEMSDAFLKGDYQKFTKYTYHRILKSIGGESRMIVALQNGKNSLKLKGMSMEKISLDTPSKIIKSNGELQCTLQEHITFKMNKGKLITTSTLIAFSEDEGKNWTFLDTSNKDEATLRKFLPNLSQSIVIPLQQKPEFRSF